MRRLFVILVIISVGVLGVFYLRKPVENEVGDGRLRIVTSFYPLYFFASEIGGDLINVKTMVPAGVEPHDYEPTAGDVAEINGSDLLVLNGAGFEGWAEKLKGDISSSEVKVVEVSEGLVMVNDPHVWLSPKLSEKIVGKLVEAIIEVDPDNGENYRSNADRLVRKIQALDTKFSKDLVNCERRDFVTSHDAFGYLAGAYNLSQIAISGLSPDEEPSISEIAKISDMAKSKNIKFIFFETLVSPRLAETVATEIGAKTLVLDPIEGLDSERQQRGENYFTIMEDNLANLRIALECK